MDSLSTPGGLLVDSLWTPMDSLWTPHGLRVDSLWTPCGLLVDSLTPHGLRVDSLWTPDKTIILRLSKLINYLLKHLNTIYSRLFTYSNYKPISYKYI
jgi:hypothetical protein